MTAQALLEFIALVDMMQDVVLMQGTEDRIHWAWESTGQFSVKSAYKAYFTGMIESDGATRIWRSRAPNSCKFFA